MQRSTRYGRHCWRREFLFSEDFLRETPGARIRVSLQSNPLTVWMEGIVDGYDAGTGALSFTCDLIAPGSGSITDTGWNLNITGANPISQQSDPGALTDGTGGSTDGVLVDCTSAGVADPTKVNDNIAELNTKIDALRTALLAAGVFV